MSRLSGLYGEKAHNFAAIAVGANASTDITVPGAGLGDFAFASTDKNLAGLVLSANVSSSDTVTITLSNNTSSSKDPSSTAMYFVKVVKKEDL